MGKLNATLLRYLEKQDFRVLTAVEMGMKNHEIVPLKLIASIAGVREGAAFKILGKLTKHRLTAYVSGKAFNGYRLTVMGYDYLALHTLVKQGAVYGLGSQIGVGKESDVYLVSNEFGEEMCLKLARLGRTSFRQLKNKRDYHRHRKNASWLYLSRIAAEMEFNFMKALHDNKFPVPIPVAYSRNAVLMSVAEGYPLCQINEISDPPNLCQKMLEFIIRLASFGLIHGDFNEFNVLVADEDSDESNWAGFTAIDFPQMVSTYHRNADFYFERDVSGVVDFFSKKFGYVCTELPKLSDIERIGSLDIELKASGYNGKNATLVDSCAEESTEEEEATCNVVLRTSDVEEGAHTDNEGNDEEHSDEDILDIGKSDNPINDIRAIVRKQIRKQKTKHAHRVLMHNVSITGTREKRKFGRTTDGCTDDFFVKLLG